MRPDSVPPGYPRDQERWVRTADRSEVFIRPIVPADIARLAHAFATADLDTLHRRFFTGAPPTDPASLAYLATVDYIDRMALVAYDDGESSIGISRYEALGDGTAEVAIAVDVAWRRRGIGTILLEALEPIAAARGIASLTALYLPENRPVERLLQSLGYGGRRIDEGLAVLEKSLDPPPRRSPDEHGRSG